MKLNIAHISGINEHKTCSTCNETKDATLFSLRGGLRCKSCRNARLREIYASEDRKQKILSYNRAQYAKHKVKIINQHKEYIKNNPEARKRTRQKYWNENKERLSAKHKEYLRTYYIKYPERRLAHSARRRANKLLRGDSNIDKYLDCTAEWFQDWIFYCINENGWTDMIMDNYGILWHLDHVVPCALWDLDNDDHKTHCFHWSNIAPMYADQNSGKKDKIIKKQVDRQNILLDKFASLRMSDDLIFSDNFS